MISGLIQDNMANLISNSREDSIRYRLYTPHLDNIIQTQNTDQIINKVQELLLNYGIPYTYVGFLRAPNSTSKYNSKYMFVIDVSTKHTDATNKIHKIY